MLSRGRGGKASPSPKKVDRGALASLGAWRWHFWFLSAAYGEDSGSWPKVCTPIPLLGAGPGAPALPLSVTHQLLGGGSKFRWMWVGLKVRVETLPSRRPPCCLPTEAPPTVRCRWEALSEHRGQAFYIKGALNIFYFLKELCL